MINELTTSTKENTISSREVAEMIGERHDSLLRKIDRINENLQNANLCSDFNQQKFGAVKVLVLANFPKGANRHLRNDGSTRYQKWEHG